jgi:glycosyltransferase involved in cell wall biosynthesis
VSDESLRIAIFGESYLPYLSGVTVSTEALARGLGAAGHEVLLVVPRPGGGSEPGSAGAIGPDPRIAWLPSFQVPKPAPAGYRIPWRIPSDALEAATSFRPQIVHAQSPFTSGLMARRLARRVRAPLVFTHHTRFRDYRHYLGPLAGPGSAAMDAYLQAFWRGCAAVVAPGTELATEISNRLGHRARPLVRTIPTGVEVAALAALPAVDPRPRAGWPADAVVMITLGRLAPEKSVDIVVEAFADVAADEPAARLLMIGGGPSEAALRNRAAQPDLAGRVYLVGHQPHVAALSVAKGADLMVAASQTETQGLVLAEALALGVPVVAIEGPGVGDSVRDGIDGLIVSAEPGAEQWSRLADALLGLARDPARRAALAEAARSGAGRFDMVARIASVVALYRELLAEPR